MNRIYYPTSYRITRQVLLALAAIVLGVVFSLVWYGKIYYGTLGVFFLAGQLLAWLTAPAFQFGDDSFHIVRLLYTKKIPYSWIAPVWQQIKGQGSGLEVAYQKPGASPNSFFLPIRDTDRMRLLFFRNCGPRFEPANRDEALSPDSTPSRLLELTKTCPNEVLENPVLPLVALEDPNLYQKIYLAAKQSALVAWFRYEPESRQRLFLCRSLKWLIGRSKLGLSDVLLRLVDAHEQYAQGTLPQRRLESTLNEIERDVRNKTVASHSNSPSTLLTSVWLLRRIIYTQPDLALENFLNQWKQHDPEAFIEFLHRKES